MLLLSEFFIITMLYFSINQTCEYAREYGTGKMPVAISEFSCFVNFLILRKKQIALKLTVALAKEGTVQYVPKL